MSVPRVSRPWPCARVRYGVAAAFLVAATLVGALVGPRTSTRWPPSTRCWTRSRSSTCRPACRPLDRAMLFADPAAARGARRTGRRAAGDGRGRATRACSAIRWSTRACSAPRAGAGLGATIAIVVPGRRWAGRGPGRGVRRLAGRGRGRPTCRGAGGGSCRRRPRRCCWPGVAVGHVPDRRADLSSSSAPAQDLQRSTRWLLGSLSGRHLAAGRRRSCPTRPSASASSCCTAGTWTCWRSATRRPARSACSPGRVRLIVIAACVAGRGQRGRRQRPDRLRRDRRAARGPPPGRARPTARCCRCRC